MPDNVGTDYRRRAAEYRARAEGTEDPSAKAQWLEIAEAWELLAETVESSAR